MGRSYTPPYVIEVDGCQGAMSWYVRAVYGTPANGKPTAANLKKYMDSFLASMEPGGANAHLARIMRKPTWARIRENCSYGAVLVTWTNVAEQAA